LVSIFHKMVFDMNYY